MISSNKRSSSSLGEVTISRFVRTGNEQGSLGRIRMWENLWDVIESYPLGVGCGNVAFAAKKVGGSDFVNCDNLHNIFLQFTTEEGFIGFLFIFWGSLSNLIIAFGYEKASPIPSFSGNLTVTFTFSPFISTFETSNEL